MEITYNTGGQLSFKALCDHCSNTTFQTIVSAERGWNNEEPRSYLLSICTICQGVMLREYPADITAEVRPGGPFKRVETNLLEQLWPTSTSFSLDVPERIRTIYEEARLVKRKSPSSFVVQLRRAFEALAKDKQAPGHTLNSQIEWLISQGQLPSVFADMIHIARRIGNLGAHDSETEVTPEDVEVSDKFFRAVIEYIYVAPALVKKARKAAGQAASPET